MKKIMIWLSISMLMLFTPSLVFAESSGYGWGYKKNNENKVPEIGKYKAMLEKYDAYYADESGEKNIYLTFDNGYEEGYTKDILDVLKKEEVPAGFFVTGHYVEEEPELIKRMVDDGHVIGNHSYHHPDFTIMRKKEIKQELEELEKSVADISKQKELTFLRPPRGMFSEDTLKWSQELGYTHVFWSLAFEDWQTNEQKGWKYAYDQIMEQIHPGAIVLLHAVSSDNAKALEKVIQKLKEEGYSFKSLNDLIAKEELSDAIFGI